MIPRPALYQLHSGTNYVFSSQAELPSFPPQIAPSHLSRSSHSKTLPLALITRKTLKESIEPVLNNSELCQILSILPHMVSVLAGPNRFRPFDEDLGQQQSETLPLAVISRIAPRDDFLHIEMHVDGCVQTCGPFLSCRCHRGWKPVKGSETACRECPLGHQVYPANVRGERRFHNSYLIFMRSVSI